MSAWIDVCGVEDLLPDRGAAALVGGQQIAVFRLSNGEVHAIANHDPFSGANVMARGLVGSAGAVTKVASPMYKQSFDLRTGQCLSEPSVRVPTFPARVRAGRVEVLPEPEALNPKEEAL